LLSNSGAEQPGEDRHVEMAMDALPTSAFVVIQTEFLFGFSKAVLNRPSSERHAKDLAK